MRRIIVGPTHAPGSLKNNGMPFVIESIHLFYAMTEWLRFGIITIREGANRSINIKHVIHLFKIFRLEAVGAKLLYHYSSTIIGEFKR